MKTIISIIFGLISTNLYATETFENVGFVENVSTATNIITIDNQHYKLSNNIEKDGSPAIFQLQAGSVVSFSGIIQNSDWIIKTLHIYPPTEPSTTSKAGQKP